MNYHKVKMKVMTKVVLTKAKCLNIKNAILIASSKQKQKEEKSLCIQTRAKMFPLSSTLSLMKTEMITSSTMEKLSNSNIRCKSICTYFDKMLRRKADGLRNKEIRCLIWNASWQASKNQCTYGNSAKRKGFTKIFILLKIQGFRLIDLLLLMV